MSKSRGGKVKASDVLAGISGGLGVATAASAPIVGADAIATPILGAASGVTLGLSKLIKAFGGSLSKSELSRVKSIMKKHDNSKGKVKKNKLSMTDMRFIDKIVDRETNKSGAGIISGGAIRTGGSLRGRKSRKRGGMTRRGGSIGSKRQVWNGTATKTSGGLKKDDLMMNKRGKIVSKKKHAMGLKRFKENKLQPKSAAELAELRKRRG